MGQQEPEIISGSESPQLSAAIEAAQGDIATLSEDDFQHQYKATKRQYAALIAAINTLREAYEALSEPGPLEIDSEVIESTGALIEDYATLMDQMHTAADFWGE